MSTTNVGKRICRECRMISTPGGIGNHQKATGHTGVILVEGSNSLPQEKFEDIIAKAVEVAVSEEKAASESMEMEYHSQLDKLLDKLDAAQEQVTLYRRILYALVAIMVVFSIALLLI